jgi:hypothetical protein
LLIKKRTELTGSGRGRTVVVVVSDRKAGCDEPDYHEADCVESNLKTFFGGEKRGNVQVRMSWVRILDSEQCMCLMVAKSLEECH